MKELLEQVAGIIADYRADELAAQFPDLELEDTFRNKLGAEWYCKDVEVCQWRDDRAQGLGAIIQADGRKLAGQWQNQGLEGLGVATFANGQRYEGEWREGIDVFHLRMQDQGRLVSTVVVRLP